jgi:16S rRNA (adenine1518-N6/adenine1519-N6)-dimethyltransferase
MHFKPKKRLGQNFLVDKNLQNKILDSLKFEKEDVLLEIGAGRGELTFQTAEKVKKVYALEIDTHLCKVLMQRARAYPNVKIIQQDILNFDFKTFFASLRKKIKVLGNIPYYISTPIIEHLIVCRGKIDCIFITVQKELARRMTALPGSKDYGSFSCFVQYYTDPKVLFRVTKNCFFPVPKVDSSFVRLKIRPILPLQPKEERLLFQIIRAAFNQRRKTLRKSLAGIIPKPALERFFSLQAKDRNIRPESLTLEDFANLTKII